jgi:hypothetical protein
MSALDGRRTRRTDGRRGQNYRFRCGSSDLVVTPLCRHRTRTVNFSIARLNIFFCDAIEVLFYAKTC